MEVRTEDVCIILGFRVTENRIYKEDIYLATYFNIRDEQGEVHGRNFDTVEVPLDLLLRIEDSISNN